MDELNARLHELGRAVAEVATKAANPAARVDARRRFLAHRESHQPLLPRGALVAFVAACGAIGLGSAVLLRSGASSLSFEVGVPPVPGITSEWVAAPGDAPLGVRFSDRTVLTLAPGARMRVTETNVHGAAIVVEHGSVHAVVRHDGPSTRWGFRAGPFEMRVTGTTFEAAWEPATETFDLNMKDGAVVVKGPLLPPERTVVGGEHLHVSMRDGRMELTTSSTTAQSPSPSVTIGPQATPSTGGSVDTSPTSATQGRPIAAKVTQPGWRALAAAGKHRDALDAAERSGFAQEIECASSGELLALSDAARFAGRPTRAREALLAMRQRFGARGRSAFLLGKIAADQQGSPGEAVTWFETYLREEPGGSLGEQALGRILEIKKHGDAAEARKVAERYLAAYPNGAYAALARSMVSP